MRKIVFLFFDTINGYPIPVVKTDQRRDRKAEPVAVRTANAKANRAIDRNRGVLLWLHLVARCRGPLAGRHGIQAAMCRSDKGYSHGEAGD